VDVGGSFGADRFALDGTVSGTRGAWTENMGVFVGASGVRDLLVGSVDMFDSFAGTGTFHLF